MELVAHYLLIFLPSALSHPQREKVSLDDLGDSPLEAKSVILPPPNRTAGFGRHPEAQVTLENGNYFQGDIVLLPEQEKIYKSGDKNEDDAASEGDLMTRTGRVGSNYRWPKDTSGKVIVPYRIDEASKYSTLERTMIRLAMDYLEHYTCIRFVELTTQTDYVVIKSANGCFSNIGKIAGGQVVSLEKGGCFTRGTIIHELIHALGYHHMQNRADRDQFVTINWQNIGAGQFENFERVNSKLFSDFNTAYDYNSVMHYGAMAFSKNGEETITVKDARYRSRIGQRRGMTQGDVDRINNMYACRK